MTDNLVIFLAFGGIAMSSGALIAVLRRPERDRVDSRVEGLARRSPRPRKPAKRGVGSSALPSLGNMLMPESESRVHRIQSRLRQAGFYQRHATAVYLGVKLLLMVGPMIVGGVLASAGMLSFTQAVILGSTIGLVGTVAPSLLMAARKSERQKQIRRALPDALDVIVVCLEGGLSLPAAFAKVAAELESAHPLLAMEMSIVRKEMELGRPTGGALRELADRFDVEELRSMATVVTQAERFGVSLVKTFRVHADTLRMKRNQHAEAMAQKAPLKLIFPTVLCIFPALYVVLMGPAAVHLLELFGNME